MRAILSPPEPLHRQKPYSDLVFCFDLDGTLVDTAPDLVRITNEMIATLGLLETDYNKARQDVGFGSRALIHNACRRAGYDLPKVDLDRLQTGFLKRYAETISQNSTPFPGVIQTLKTLKRGGAVLTVCTNKPGYLARPLLDDLRMTWLFDNIVGGDEAPRAKPDARHIFMAAGPKAVSKQILMVGDSYPDIRAGHNARVPTFLMTYGYTPHKAHKLKATYTLDHFRDILNYLL
jgi:phosphoglycolate phosphatase